MGELVEQLKSNAESTPRVRVIRIVSCRCFGCSIIVRFFIFINYVFYTTILS